MQPPLAASFCVSLHTDTVYLTLLVYDSYLLHVPPFCSLFIKLQVKVTYVYCTMSLPQFWIGSRKVPDESRIRHHLFCNE